MGHPCHLIDCGDGLWATLTTPDGVWTAGSYELTVTRDGGVTTCPFEFDPSKLESGDQLAVCGDDLAIRYQDEVLCSSPDSCSLVPGHHALRLVAYKTPDTVQVQLARDGSPLDASVLVGPTVVPSGDQVPTSCPLHCKRLEVTYSITSG